MNLKLVGATLLAAAVLVPVPEAIAQKSDFGEEQERLLRAQSNKLFGFSQPIQRSATEADVVAREIATAEDRQFLAGSLRAEYVARNVGYRADMITFWPNDTDYTHLIVCNEGGRSDAGVGEEVSGQPVDGQNTSVQRIHVETGTVENILHGMDRCDGIRTTQWGTVLATEETDDGQVYEIIDPLHTDGHWIADRPSGDIRNGLGSPLASATVAKRDALVTQAWEGLEVLDNGVVIGGDELRSGQDGDGGAVFRFVPDVLYDCVGAPVRPGQLCDNAISDLSQSPLVSGDNYALFHACSGDDDYGQGCEYGDAGRWVEVGAPTARADAAANGATGYCRPEDLHVDRSYGEFAGEDGIRWCWTNTCGGSDGEALCATESSSALDAQVQVFVDIGGTAGTKAFLSIDGSVLAEVDSQRFVDSSAPDLDLRLSSHDNLDIQPVTSNVYMIEDTDFGDVWACLPDGGDKNETSDGCVALLSITDPEAEPTGFIFDGTGRTAFYNVQHGSQHESLLDFESNFACDSGDCNGYTDDLIMITGFKVPNKPE
ncbi:MAG: PhoX family protein [Woeseiaceae bacterium]|nr:PhoX family protein [Woeseiaceae bacterium]